MKVPSNGLNLIVEVGLTVSVFVSWANAEDNKIVKKQKNVFIVNVRFIFLPQNECFFQENLKRGVMNVLRDWKYVMNDGNIPVIRKCEFNCNY